MYSLFASPDREGPVIIDDPAEVEAKLRTYFGFGVEQCHQALRAGHSRGALATAHSAVGQFGSDFFFGVIEELRGQLASKGYVPYVAKGLELARRSDNALQVTSCMATDGVGDRTGEPRPKNPKGGSSEAAIHDNQGTLGMLEPGRSWQPIQTWWLLYQAHGLDRSRSLTAEISLPSVFRSKTRFEWEVRIILPKIDLNDLVEAAPVPTPANPIEVPITRRAG
jgi:hypothetical protein